MTNDYSEVIGDLERIQDRLRSMRDRHCEPKPNANPPYLALSNGFSAFTTAIADIAEEATLSRARS